MCQSQAHQKKQQQIQQLQLNQKSKQISWQVTVDNDGVVPVKDEPVVDGHGSAGLGLRSMTERVEALGGRVRITPRPRFTVFATIPKNGQGREGAS